MLLSHAHIDHSGRIPKLVNEGFKGTIYTTNATKDLLDVMLKDSAKIQENDADWENKKRKRAGKKAIKPLYTTNDAKNSLKYVKDLNYDSFYKINDSISVRFLNAGHMLGSSIIEIYVKESSGTSKLVFSGDLGMPGRPILKDPKFVDSCDYLIIESTYGNTVHEDYKSQIKKLIEIIENTTSNNGTVIIPAFAVGRTQEIIYELNNYYEKLGKAYQYKKIPIYIDSPMAVKSTKVFTRNSYDFDDEAKEKILSGDNVFKFDNLHYVEDVNESKMLNQVKFPRVIISSSGMATAGRVRHHLKHNLYDENSSVVFVGYQAEGSLGRILIDGAKTVKLLGEEIAVKAAIYRIEGVSGHADEPFLLEWVNSIKKKPKKIFLVHGEEDQMLPFQKALIENLGLNAEIAEENIEYDLKAFDEKDYEEIYSNSSSIDHSIVNLEAKIENLRKIKKTIEKDNISIEQKNLLEEKIKDISRDIMDINMILGK